LDPSVSRYVIFPSLFPKPEAAMFGLVMFWTRQDEQDNQD